MDADVTHQTWAPGARLDGLIEEWRLHGVLHRVGGPARVYNGSGPYVLLQEWYVHGYCCRALGSSRVFTNSPETTCRTLFAWWAANRKSFADRRAASRASAPDELLILLRQRGNDLWQLWKSLPRHAMAIVLMQLANGREGVDFSQLGPSCYWFRLLRGYHRLLRDSNRCIRPVPQLWLLVILFQPPPQYRRR